MDKKKKVASGRFFLFAISMAAVMGGMGRLNRLPLEETVTAASLAALLLIIMAAFLQLNHITILDSRQNTWLVLSAFLVSLLMITFSPEYELFHFWLLGPVVIGLMVHPCLGLSFHFILTVIFCILNGCAIAYFICYFILGALIILLIQYVKTPLSFFYTLVICLTMNVTMSFLLVRFIPERKAASGLSLVSTAAVLTLPLLLSLFLNRFFLKNREEGGEPAGELQRQEAVPAALKELAEEEHELLLRLRLFSKKRYIHSVMVGEVAGRAAQVLGADVLLAKAGGRYHEIGRPDGSDYIAQGVRLARESRFPPAVVAIIRQHNARFEKPASIEAAIVMLTDSVLTTLDYLEGKKGENALDPKKVVEQVFRIRLEKGDLSESGMSVGRFQELKDFFEKNCF